MRIGVAHAPYLRVLDQYARDGYDITFAGHTHGGQVCLPFKGAIVTNCDLDTEPRQGPAPAPGRLRAGRPGLVLAARLGRRRDLAVRPDPALLPARGDPADAAPEGLVSPIVDPVRSTRIRSGRLATPSGLWRSLVARVVRDDEAAGSNPVTPTNVMSETSRTPDPRTWVQEFLAPRGAR